MEPGRLLIWMKVVLSGCICGVVVLWHPWNRSKERVEDELPFAARPLALGLRMGVAASAALLSLSGSTAVCLLVNPRFSRADLYAVDWVLLPCAMCMQASASSSSSQQHKGHHVDPQQHEHEHLEADDQGPPRPGRVFVHQPVVR